MQIKLNIILLTLATLVSSIATAQLRNSDTTTKTIVRSPRFEIIQSPLAVTETFKLDTYFGDAQQLYVDSNGTYYWHSLLRLPGKGLDTWLPNSSNYSIFFSTLGVRYTYLLNVNTGTTWQLVIDKKTKVYFFEPMDSY